MGGGSKIFPRTSCEFSFREKVMENQKCSPRKHFKLTVWYNLAREPTVYLDFGHGSILSLAKTLDPIFQTSSYEFQVRSKLGILNIKFGISNSKFGLQDYKLWMWTFKTWNEKFKLWNVEFKVLMNRSKLWGQTFQVLKPNGFTFKVSGFEHQNFELEASKFWMIDSKLWRYHFKLWNPWFETRKALFQVWPKLGTSNLKIDSLTWKFWDKLWLQGSKFEMWKYKFGQNFWFLDWKRGGQNRDFWATWERNKKWHDNSLEGKNVIKSSLLFKIIPAFLRHCLAVARLCVRSSISALEILPRKWYDKRNWTLEIERGNLGQETCWKRKWKQ